MKRYAGFKVIDYGNGRKDAIDIECPPEQPPIAPRSFMFAVNSTYKNISGVERALKRLTEKNRAHVHALAVLNREWLICQRSFKKPHEFSCSESHSFELFCATVLSDLTTKHGSEARCDEALFGAFLV